MCGLSTTKAVPGTGRVFRGSRTYLPASLKSSPKGSSPGAASAGELKLHYDPYRRGAAVSARLGQERAGRSARIMGQLVGETTSEQESGITFSRRRCRPVP